MKLSIDARDLTSTIRLVEGFVPAEPRLPALSSVLLQADEGRLAITASDLETTATLSASCAVEEPGAACVQARTLIDLARLQTEELKFSRVADGLRISAGKSRHTFKTTSPEDFVALPSRSSLRGMFNGISE